MTLPASGAISFSNIDTELGHSSTTQISMNCTGFRALFHVSSGAITMNCGYNKHAVPGTPTVGTPTASTYCSVSVPFTAPGCVGASSITGYTVTSCPGAHTGTGSSSPITVGSLSGSTAYTFKVKATNSYGTGPCSSASSSVTTPSAAGSQSYTTPGTYSWVAPAGVTSVSVVAVGAGGNGNTPNCGNRGGGGGALAYKNNISVTPGNSYTVIVGAPQTCVTTGYSGFNGSCVKAGSGSWGMSGTHQGAGQVLSGTGYAGGSTGGSWSGGGGAGGYSGAGGTAGYSYAINPTSGAGGGGAGGGSSFVNNTAGGGGGGVGIFGQGSNGVPLNNGTFGSCYGAAGSGGGGGSGGSNGSVRCGSNGGAGGAYGGGGGAPLYIQCEGPQGSGGTGGVGAVRIVWPGSTRTFPSTCVGSP